MAMREIYARIVLLQRFVESITKCDQQETIGSKCDTQTSKFVKGKNVHSQLVSSPVPQRLISH